MTKRYRQWARTLGVYLAIIAVTLGLLDVMLMVTGLFPPPHDYGDPQVGWLAAPATGAAVDAGCVEFASETIYRYRRNADGYRTAATAAELRGPGDRLEIAVTGDSHTDLCAPNEETHFGLTEAGLEEAGIPSTVFSYGAGRYSPLQAFLAIEPAITAYDADVLILNLYTGNDFYDMLRVDDRPHFQRDGEGYRIAEPVWYQYDEPGVVHRSRVLHALGSLADATGVGGLMQRLRYLSAAAREQGEPITTVFSYVNDLRKATAPEVGYPGAFAAQMLNQQLFFHRFPGATAEGIARVEAVLRLIRERYPDLVLVLSPIPSYQVVHPTPIDPALERVTSRLPMSYADGVRQEEDLYRTLEAMAGEAGWVFVDNLDPLRAYDGDAPLYNDFDYHILPVASAIIARAQVDAIRSAVSR